MFAGVKSLFSSEPKVKEPSRNHLGHANPKNQNSQTQKTSTKSLGVLETQQSKTENRTTVKKSVEQNPQNRNTKIIDAKAEQVIGSPEKENYTLQNLKTDLETAGNLMDKIGSDMEVEGERIVQESQAKIVILDQNLLKALNSKIVKLEKANANLNAEDELYKMIAPVLVKLRNLKIRGEQGENIANEVMNLKPEILKVEQKIAGQ